MSRLECARESRRLDVRRAGLNGIDFVEVADDLRSLCVHFLGPIPDELIGVEAARHFVIEGGRRVRGIVVVETALEEHDDTEEGACLRVIVDKPGDASTYRLCVVDANGPYPGFDPRYSCVDFTFAVACPAESDCAATVPCPPDVGAPPAISYLAKDYASFRTLILDRMARLVPNWAERHVPDLGITLVELLADVGDQLSYYQDAVATEAFLDTARHRISVRRHARLVDYRLHEGTAARAWVHLDVAADDVTLPVGALFITGVPLLGERGTIERSEVPADPAVQFETFVPLLAGDQPVLRRPHNEIRLHTWGDDECCLGRGATAATLRDGPAAAAVGGFRLPAAGDGYAEPDQPGETDDSRVLNLAPGDLLLFEEVLDPATASAADADPAHRHVVRLTRVAPGRDELYGQNVLEVEWAQADALPFPLCISSIGPAPGCEPVEPVSVARGNIVLTEHGVPVAEQVGPVPEAAIGETCEAPCRPADAVPAWRPFRPPPLGTAPLAFSEPVVWSDGGAPTPAASLVRQDPHAAVPVLHLGDTGHHAPPGLPRRWEVRPDLLGSGPDDQHVVVEIDNDRRAHLRFGDDELGERPRPGTLFTARYRAGGGVAGNVGAETIVHLVVEHVGEAPGLRPRNPLAALWGVDPQPLDEARQLAPHTFRGIVQRAITAADYATVAARLGGDQVQRTGAALRWTGSWYRADVAVDTLAGVPDAERLFDTIADGLAASRRIGHDVHVGPATTVPIIVGLDVCVDAHHQRAKVGAALVDALGSGRSAGVVGLFHPDRLTFGERVDASRVVAAAMGVVGVDSVTVTRLERVDHGATSELEDGFLAIGPLEIARLDNDPNAPENGRLELHLGGGR